VRGGERGGGRANIYIEQSINSKPPAEHLCAGKNTSKILGKEAEERFFSFNETNY